MSDFTILHLSDLHIGSDKTGYSRVLTKLLDDIEKQTESYPNNSIVIVVTGDIFNAGPKFEDKKSGAYANALAFFKDLKKKLDKKVIRIYCVPGNHDKYRDTLDKYINYACRGDLNTLTDDFYENVWPTIISKYQRDNGTGYIELYKDIFKLFSSEKSNKKFDFLDRTFGVDSLTIDDKTYNFVMLNTSWNCFDKSDERDIVIGDFQFRKIKEEFNSKITDTQNSLTIVLGHHPTACLQGKEEDLLIKNLIAFDEIDANIYICGHRHDQIVSNWVNSRHSMSTFVSGLGWPNEEKPEYVGYRTYAFYEIDTKANTIEVKMRATNDDGDFMPNFRIYTGHDSYDRKSMVFPLRVEKAQRYITLSKINPDDDKAYYLNSELIKYIQKYQNMVAETCFEVSKVYVDVCTEFFLDVEDKEFNNSTEKSKSKTLWNDYYFKENERDLSRSKVKPLFDKYKTDAFMMFHDYLFQICSIMGKIMTRDAEKDDIIRFHFRYFSKNPPKTYKNLCMSIDSEIYRVSDIEYGQLIKAAYENKQNKRALIYSVNKKYASGGISERWKDFITVIPMFAENSITIREDGMKPQKYPAITFGVTIGNEKFEKLLYSLDFFSIGDVITILIDRFFDYFMFSLDDYCEWVDKEYCTTGLDLE